jgi:hypothetical protein
MLRDDLIPGFPMEGKEEQCAILLSEIPLDADGITLGEFKIVPLVREKPDFFKPYALLVSLPKKFDFFSAPLLGEAMAPLLSFSLRRRIKACRMPHVHKAVTKESELPEQVFTYMRSVSVGPEGSLQQSLTPEERKKRIADMKMIFEKLRKIGKDEYLAIIRALHQYQLALLTYRDDIGLAYTLLVSCIETMAQQFVKDNDLKVDFSCIHDHQLWERLFIRNDLPKELSDEIRKTLIKRERFLSLKFRFFVINTLPGSFWASPDSRAKEFDDYIESLRVRYFDEHKKQGPDHMRTWWWLYDPERKPRREELESLLKDIYDVRSEFSHLGESPSMEVIDLYETAKIKVEFSDNDQRLKFVRAPPSFFWFERVVHDSILDFVSKL